LKIENESVFGNKKDKSDNDEHPVRDATLGKKRNATCEAASRQGCIPIGMRGYTQGIPFYRAIFPNGNAAFIPLSPKAFIHNS